MKDIDSLYRKWEVCLRSGNSIVNTKNKVILTERPNEPWEVDLIGRIETNGKNKFVLVCIDHYSKWVESKVFNGKHGIEISTAIKELIIDKHGVAASAVQSKNSTKTC